MATAYDSNLPKLLGGNLDKAPNLYMPLSYAMYLGTDLATVPEAATYRKWLQQTHPGEGATLYGLYAWAAGARFVQAMKTAEMNPTQAGLLAAVQNTHSFNDNGLLATSDPGGGKGAICIVMAGVKDGQFARLDPASGYLCSPGSYFNRKLSS